MHSTLALTLLLLIAAPALAQEDPATPVGAAASATTTDGELPPELPDDDAFVTGSAELSEDDTVAVLEGLDAAHGRPDTDLSEEQVTKLAEELGHEMWLEDRILYDRLFARYKTERIDLDQDQEYYHQVLMGKLASFNMPHKDELSNLFRFYIFLLAAHEGMSFKAAHLYGASGESFYMGDGVGGYTPGVLDRFPSTLAGLVERLGWTRYPMHKVPTGYVKTFLGIELWEITKDEPDTSKGYLPNVGYARAVCAFARKYACGTGLRGISESDLLVAWILKNYASEFLTDRALEWANVAWPNGMDDPAYMIGRVFECKTTPSLAFNNEVARKLAEPLTWEQMGMPTEGFYNKLARFNYEHPVLIQFIPVYGACWRAGCALLECYEGRDAEGNELSGGGRTVAAGSFLFNYAMAVADVFMVKGIAQVTATGVGASANAVGRLLPAQAREALTTGKAVVQRVCGRMMQSTLKLVPQGGVNAARAVRGVLVRQLKFIRNATVAPPVDLARRAQETAMRAWQNMKEVVKAQKAIKPLLTRGEEAYNLRSVCGIVDRVTGKTYSGINASGSVRGAINATTGATSAHPRLQFIKSFIQRVTGKPSLKPWQYENCAEWEAVNNALQDGAKMEDLIIFTSKNPGGKAFACCLNCRLTTLGSTVVSNNDQWIGQLLGTTATVRNTIEGVSAITGGRQSD